MNLVIGFGSTEKEFEAAEEAAIREHIEGRFRELGLRYFTDEFAEEIRSWLCERAIAYQVKGDEYKRADEYPDRYSYYWATLLSDASHMVPVLSIHHVNRRHGLSPDGWALMRTKLLFDVVSYELAA